MYPANERFSDLMSTAFLNAVQDENMLMPTGYKNPSDMLFPNYQVSVRLGGDASMTGTKDPLTLPLSSEIPIIVTVGRSYGNERGYVGADPYVDVEAYVPFSVWADTSDSQDDMEQRLEFARNHRQNVFSAHGLNMIQNAMINSRPRPISPITGLVVVDYRWKFFYSRS